MIKKTEQKITATVLSENCSECPFLELIRVLDITGRYKGGVRQECKYLSSCMWVLDHVGDADG